MLRFILLTIIISMNIANNKGDYYYISITKGQGDDYYLRLLLKPDLSSRPLKTSNICRIQDDNIDLNEAVEKYNHKKFAKLEKQNPKRDIDIQNLIEYRRLFVRNYLQSKSSYILAKMSEDVNYSDSELKLSASFNETYCQVFTIENNKRKLDMDAYDKKSSASNFNKICNKIYIYAGGQLAIWNKDMGSKLYAVKHEKKDYFQASLNYKTIVSL